MSEIINNREYRQKVLKELIQELHNGADPQDVKNRFVEVVKDVSPTEIAEMEQSLINEGMPAEEIKRLCDVHAAMFKDSLDEMVQDETVPGHPVHTFRLENRALEQHMEQQIIQAWEAYQSSKDADALSRLREGLNLLMDLDKHYSRKENLLFPYLEKYGITAPPTVMWGKDDDVRKKLKEAIGLGKEAALDAGKADALIAAVNETVTIVKEMIYKEENILFPMCLETLTEDEWGEIMAHSDEIGFCLVDPGNQWQPKQAVGKTEKEQAAAVSPAGYLKFETGILTLEEINGIFNTLPIDITFVDKDGTVKYFSAGKERIFARPKTIIGRKVTHCHPPTSVHIVEKIVEDFVSGKRDHADFWIQMQGMFVYIRYFAVRDKDGNYLGTVEVSQNIKPIQALEGEKRLLEE